MPTAPTLPVHRPNPVPPPPPGVQRQGSPRNGLDDSLTRATLAALDRPTSNQVGAGFFRTTLLGLVSAGLLPAIALNGRLAKLSAWEQQHAWHVAEWTKLHLSQETGEHLHAVAKKMRVSRFWSVLTWVGIVIAVVAALLGLGLVPSALDGLTYWAQGGESVDWASFWFVDARDAAPAVLVYLGGLTLAYLAHLGNVNAHRASVARFLDTFNRQLKDEEIPRVRLPRFVWGIRLFPMSVSILLATTGMLWLVPLAIATTAHQRWARRESYRVRTELGGRLRSLLAVSRPLQRPPEVNEFVGKCPHERCDAKLPAGAEFCPRCGRRVGTWRERLG